MKKTIILFLSVFVALFVFGQKPAFTAEGENTFRNELYGIEFSLPAPRWLLSDSSDNLPKRGAKKVRIARAKDSQEEANLSLIMREAHKKKTLKEWMQKLINKKLKNYSKGNAYTVMESSEKEVVIKSGEKVRVEYLTLSIGVDKTREVAFVYFSHKDRSSYDRFFFFFIRNAGRRADVKGFVEKTLLPRLVLF